VHGAAGVFLRQWRSEWAGLSRARLAQAVTTTCGGGKPVTAATVREWEQGQPPRTTEELKALLAVMGANGLLPVEVAQFRDALFADLARRQYPELFDDTDPAGSADVEALAEAQWTAALEREQPPDVVGLVLFAEMLRQALLKAGTPELSPEQERRLQVALCLLQACLARNHDFSGRGTLAGRTWGATAQFAEAFVGAGGLPASVPSVLHMRMEEAHYMSHSSEGLQWPRRLLGLAEAAWAQGEPDTAIKAYCSGLHCLADIRGIESAHLMGRAREYAPVAEDLGGDCRSASHWDLFWAALAQGLWSDAEWAMAAFDHWRDDSGFLGGYWHWARGMFDVNTGAYDEAQRHLELALARQRALGLEEEGRLRDLETCELARRGDTHAAYRRVRMGRGLAGRRKTAQDHTV
jgi:hypothetical protein